MADDQLAVWRRLRVGIPVAVAFYHSVVRAVVPTAIPSTLVPLGLVLESHRLGTSSGAEGGSTAGLPFVLSVQGAAVLAYTAAEGRERGPEERLGGCLWPRGCLIEFFFSPLGILLPSFRLGVPTAVTGLVFFSTQAFLLAQGS